MLVLSITYYGPAEEARSILAPVLTPEISNLAVSDQIVAMPLGDMFIGSQMFNTHGGFKEQYNARTKRLSRTSIREIYSRWQTFGDEIEDARARTIVVLSAYNAQMTMAMGSGTDGGRKPFLGRDRPFFGQTITWYSKKETNLQPTNSERM